jgi:hypothetical protein
MQRDVSFKLTQIVAYADDVALLARFLKALKEIFSTLQNEATQVGLNINEDKTKYEVCPKIIQPYLISREPVAWP